MCCGDLVIFFIFNFLFRLFSWMLVKIGLMLFFFKCCRRFLILIVEVGVYVFLDIFKVLYIFIVGKILVGVINVIVFLVELFLIIVKWKLGWILWLWNRKFRGFLIFFFVVFLLKIINFRWDRYIFFEDFVVSFWRVLNSVFVWLEKMIVGDCFIVWLWVIWDGLIICRLILYWLFMVLIFIVMMMDILFNFLLF